MLLISTCSLLKFLWVLKPSLVACLFSIFYFYYCYYCFDSELLKMSWEALHNQKHLSMSLDHFYISKVYPSPFNKSGKYFQIDFFPMMWGSVEAIPRRKKGCIFYSESSYWHSSAGDTCLRWQISIRPNQAWPQALFGSPQNPGITVLSTLSNR